MNSSNTYKIAIIEEIKQISQYKLSKEEIEILEVVMTFINTDKVNCCEKKQPKLLDLIKELKKNINATNGFYDNKKLIEQNGGSLEQNRGAIDTDNKYHLLHKKYKLMYKIIKQLQ